MEDLNHLFLDIGKHLDKYLYFKINKSIKIIMNLLILFNFSKLFQFQFE